MFVVNESISDTTWFQVEVDLKKWALPLLVTWGVWDYGRREGFAIHILCVYIVFTWDKTNPTW